MMINKVVLATAVFLLGAEAQLFDSYQGGFQSRGANSNQIVSQVIDKLSPTIAQAVQNALRGSLSNNRPQTSPSVGVSYEPLESAPARYDYKYSVANPGTQTYISQEEQRDGSEVVGRYSYVDPTGAIVTVSYTAGVNGYQETGERQEGAVRITSPEISPVNNIPAPSYQPQQSGLNVEALIQQVLTALQPAIQQSVNTA